MSITPLVRSPGIKKANCGDFDILLSCEKRKQAILYFHGFPGPCEHLNPGENRLVDYIYDKTKDRFDFYYPLYTLKKKFRFFDSIQDSFSALDFLMSRRNYESVTLIGQSWGAVVALPLTQKHTFKQTFLITPFVSLPKGKAAWQLVRTYSGLYPGLLKLDDLEELVEEFERIADVCAPRLFLEALPDLVVFAAEHDEIVPLKIIQEAIGSGSSTTKIVILKDQTHFVERREEFGGLFYSEISKLIE